MNRTANWRLNGMRSLLGLTLTCLLSLQLHAEEAKTEDAKKEEEKKASAVLAEKKVDDKKPSLKVAEGVKAEEAVKQEVQKVDGIDTLGTSSVWSTKAEEAEKKGPNSATLFLSASNNIQNSLATEEGSRAIETGFMLNVGHQLDESKTKVGFWSSGSYTIAGRNKAQQKFQFGDLGPYVSFKTGSILGGEPGNFNVRTILPTSGASQDNRMIGTLRLDTIIPYEINEKWSATVWLIQSAGLFNKTNTSGKENKDSLNAVSNLLLGYAVNDDVGLDLYLIHKVLTKTSAVRRTDYKRSSEAASVYLGATMSVAKNSTLSVGVEQTRNLIGEMPRKNVAILDPRETEWQLLSVSTF